MPHGYDYIDGRRVPQTVITKDYVLTGTHQGTVRVESGAFTLAGAINGTLNIQSGATATIAGRQCGSVSVGSRAMVRVTGSIEGTTDVAEGATLTIEEEGKLAGTLRNDGLVVVRGVFGGPRTGKGELRLEEGGHLKQPKIVDGVYYYEW